jgi:hypothetical protein
VEYLGLVISQDLGLYLKLYLGYLSVRELCLRLYLGIGSRYWVVFRDAPMYTSRFRMVSCVGFRGAFKSRDVDMDSGIDLNMYHI